MDGEGRGGSEGGVGGRGDGGRISLRLDCWKLYPLPLTVDRLPRLSTGAQEMVSESNPGDGANGAITLDCWEQEMDRGSAGREEVDGS